MKISELISKLQEFMKQNGDICIAGFTPIDEIGTEACLNKQKLFRNTESKKILYMNSAGSLFDDEISEEICEIIFKEENTSGGNI